MRQLISSDEASCIDEQHVTPCTDCPWARSALPGWLADMTADEWLRYAHGEAFIECHALVARDGTPLQCAGASIYRANVVKRCRDKAILVLPKDKELVFSNPSEFKNHHEG